MATRVGLMGFGRIGRNILRQAANRDDIDIVAISDLASPSAMAYLLQYDTVYGRFAGGVGLEGQVLYAGRQRCRLLRGVTPLDLPWDAFGVDIVVEATHQYRTRELLEGHLVSGAKRVILTTPALGDIDRTIVHGVNHQNLKSSDHIVSCSSTTTHALALTLKVLDEAIGVQRAFMTNVHAYTSDQKLADMATDDLRRSRSAAENLIPNETWAPEVVGQMMPHLAGCVQGVAVNVPVANGSNIDLVSQLARKTTVEEVKAIVDEAAAGVLAPYLQVAREPIVSSDVIGNTHSAIFDQLATLLMAGDLLKTVTWYDNGWGYASRILETIDTMAAFIAEEAP